MSRSTPEKAMPSGPCQVPTDSSIGISLPSRRSPASSTTLPASLELPVRRTRAMPSLCRARNRSGMITVRGRPTISSAVQPNSRSAPRFQVSTRPELSADTIASTAASVTAANCSWEAARASAARRRSTRGPSSSATRAIRSSRPGSPARSWVTNSSSTATTPSPPVTGTAMASRTPARWAGRARSKRPESRMSSRAMGWPLAQAGQAFAELVGDGLAGVVQLLEPVAVAVPGGAADQHPAGRQPHLAHGAAGEVADGLDGRGQHLVAGVGLADQLEHELEEAALVLGPLHLGEVADHGDGQLGAAAAVADQRQVEGAPDELAGEHPHPAGLDLAAVQPLLQDLLDGRVRQLLVGRVGQRRQGAAAQAAGRARPEQGLQGAVGDQNPAVPVEHARRGGRLLDQRLGPERPGRSPPPLPPGALARVRPHLPPPTFRPVRAIHAGRPDWQSSAVFIPSRGFRSRASGRARAAGTAPPPGPSKHRSGTRIGTGPVLTGRGRSALGCPPGPADTGSMSGNATRELEARLLRPAGPERFGPAELDGLPGPVRRHLAQAIAPGTPLHTSARLTPA